MTIATDMLASYMAAEAAVLTGKTVSFNGRTHTTEDLAEIRKGRKEWEARVNAEATGSSARSTIGGLGYSVASFGERN